MDFDVCILGGCGRVGLPLALAFADQGLRVAIHDIDDGAVGKVRSGRMPFHEAGAEPILARCLGQNLEVRNDPELLGRAEAVIVVVGTPVDDHLNPKFAGLNQLFARLEPHLVDGQLVVLRSTIYPGTTQRLSEFLQGRGRRLPVSFCPERIAEGKALVELRDLPQIVSGTSEEAVERASALFRHLAGEIVVLSPFEAELAKLFTNSWRYIQFAAANQFYMMAQQFGADFYRIYDAMRYRYPRTEGFPGAGFAAGPCLFKDTMQLAAFNNNNFFLGHAAMLVNEGLPNFVVGQLRERHDLGRMVVGLLGMAFKGDSDDPRDSLSYKLKKILQFEAREVLCADPHLEDPDLVGVDELLRRSDVVILATPHKAWRTLEIPEGKVVVDVWNFFGKGGHIP